MFNHPKLSMTLAVSMMLFGIVVPFLMVLHIFESTFFLNFISYISSTLGLFLGMISLASTHIARK